MIQVLWYRQVEAVIDVRLGDADADPYKYEPMVALLARQETIKKYKHGKHCYKQQKHFLPFVLSVDRMLGRESLVELLKLSQVMAAKRAEPLSQVWGWVNSRTTIAVARSYSQMIRGAQLPSPLWKRDQDWYPELVIVLAG